MTALFMDSFDHYGTGDVKYVSTITSPAMNNMLNAGWNIYNTGGSSNMYYGITTPIWGPARTGPYAFYRESGNSGNQANACTRPLPVPLTRLFMSVSIAIDNLPFEITTLLQFRTNLDAGICDLRVLPNGSLQMYNAATSTVISTTAGSVMAPHTWYFMEMDVNTAGNWILRVNDASGSDTPILQGALSGGTIAIVGLGGRLS